MLYTEVGSGERGCARRPLTTTPRDKDAGDMADFSIRTFVTINGRRGEWAERIGITPGTLHARLKDGWSVGDALTQTVAVSSSVPEKLMNLVRDWQVAENRMAV